MVAKMRKIPGYRKLFQDVFGRDIVIEDVGKAVASFQRTVLSGNSPVDKFDQGGDETALNEPHNVVLNCSERKPVVHAATPDSTSPMKSFTISVLGGIPIRSTSVGIW